MNISHPIRSVIQFLASVFLRFYLKFYLQYISLLENNYWHCVRTFRFYSLQNQPLCYGLNKLIAEGIYHLLCIHEHCSKRPYLYLFLKSAMKNESDWSLGVIRLS